MKFIIQKKLFAFCVSLLVLTIAAPLDMAGQQSVLKKATKSLFVLNTFDDAGRLLGSSKGFYVGSQGEALSCYEPMRGASRAVVIGADGKEHAVECILGANETYNVVKFKVADTKSVPVQLATTTIPVGGRAWMLSGKDVKKAAGGTVRKVEKFKGQNDYYTLAMSIPTGTEGSPLFNDEGRVVGLMERPLSESDTLSYAVSALFADSLTIKGLSINDASLRAIKIKKDLPQQLEQAVVTLYLASSIQDSTAYDEMIEDFVRRFPTAPDGYYYRALRAYQRDDFEAVQNDMELSIRMSEQKDAPHYSYSRFIYEKVLFKPQLPYESWTLDKALSEAVDAYAFSPQPAYRHQQALILFAQQKYQDAAQVYTELLQGPMRSPELFHEASRCHVMMGDTLSQLALLDSAVAMFDRPYLRNAAPYLLARSQALLDAGKFRQAVLDMNAYEELMRGQLNDRFYYLRHQADLGGRLYQQALNDINKAIELRPDYDVYLSEKASLLIRVGMLDEAIETASQLITLSPSQSDGYLFLGLAQCIKGQKSEGLSNLQKAVEKGDPQAAELMKRYQ